MTHLLNMKGSVSGHSKRETETTPLKEPTPMKHSGPVPRNPQAEAAHVHQIVTTRGEGLTDLLMMKREFERHIGKVSSIFSPTPICG